MNYRSIILDRRREGNMEAMYNFPVGNSINVQQLMTFVNEIFWRQNSAFKLNLAFGYILRHRETTKVHYFRSFDHEVVLDLPFYISRRSGLAGLESRIKNLNLLELLMRQRPDTKWVIEQSQTLFIVFKTKFLLGKSDIRWSLTSAQAKRSMTFCAYSFA